jgi:hypothetical protein
MAKKSPPKYQLNICKNFNSILTGIMIFCRELLYSARCSHSAVRTENNTFPKWNYGIKVKILWGRFIFQN